MEQNEKCDGDEQLILVAVQSLSKFIDHFSYTASPPHAPFGQEKSVPVGASIKRSRRMQAIMPCSLSWCRIEGLYAFIRGYEIGEELSYSWQGVVCVGAEREEMEALRRSEGRSNLVIRSASRMISFLTARDNPSQPAFFDPCPIQPQDPRFFQSADSAE